MIPGPAASASAALQGGAAAARGPEILPDRSTFVAPRGAQAEDASGEKGNEGGEEEGRCRLSVVFFFFGGMEVEVWGGDGFFLLIRKFDGKKHRNSQRKMRGNEEMT